MVDTELTALAAESYSRAYGVRNVLLFVYLYLLHIRWRSSRGGQTNMTTLCYTIRYDIRV